MTVELALILAILTVSPVLFVTEVIRMDLVGLLVFVVVMLVLPLFWPL